MEQVIKQYPLLFEFLNKYFHENAYEDYPLADNATHLIEESVVELFQKGMHSTHVRTLLEEMHYFIHTPIWKELKDDSLQDVLKVELIGLKPLDFVQHLYYIITIEQWKQR